MRVRVFFYSYFRDLTGISEFDADIPQGERLGDLMHRLHEKFPKLKAMQRSTLMAVGVEYQQYDYLLREGDEVSLFPPVQGG